MDRRTIMIWAIRGIGLVIAGLAGIPSLVNALSPVRKPVSEPEAWRSLGMLDEFPVGEMRMAVVDVPPEAWGRFPGGKGVYAWRRSTDEVVVFSRSCSDLGCPLTWDPGSECFFCPCHGGIFAKDGERMAGPPSRPMFRYASRIRNNELEIDLRSVPPMA